MNNVVTLYGTLGCHLCEIAEQEILNATKKKVVIENIDIADDLDLLEKYGTKIPVLDVFGTYLFWPFTSDQVNIALENTANIHKQTRRYLR